MIYAHVYADNFYEWWFKKRRNRVGIKISNSINFLCIYIICLSIQYFLKIY